MVFEQVINEEKDEISPHQLIELIKNKISEKNTEESVPIISSLIGSKHIDVIASPLLSMKKAVSSESLLNDKKEIFSSNSLEKNVKNVRSEDSLLKDVKQNIEEYYRSLNTPSVNENRNTLLSDAFLSIRVIKSSVPKRKALSEKKIQKNLSEIFSLNDDKEYQGKK